MKILKTKIILFLVLAAVVFSFSCSNFDAGKGEQPPGRQTGTLIVAGYTIPSIEPEACYWIGPPGNPSQMQIENLHNSTEMYYSIVCDMDVSGNNIYVCGEYYDGSSYLPCYWVNNSSGRVNLPIPAGVTSGTAHRIIVDNSNIYILGTYDDSGLVYCYWVNGTRYDIDTAAVGSEMYYINDMAVYNEQIYIAGQCTSDMLSYFIPGDTQYWPGGVLYDEAYNISVNSDGVHINSYNSSFMTYSYWLNDTEDAAAAFGTTDTANYIIYYDCSTMFISGTDIFIAGYDASAFPFQACYWQNGTLTNLGDGTNESHAYAIHFFEGNVYTAGIQDDAGTSRPCYWINDGSVQFIGTDEGYTRAIWDPYMDKNFDLEKCMKNIRK